MTVSGIARLSALVAVTASALAVGVMEPPTASADEVPLLPSKTTCGWTTCTQYWSVARTKKLNDEWKGAVMGAYGGALAATGTAAGVAGATGVGAIPAAIGGGAAAAGITYKMAEFDVQVSQAAADGRCLIFKYPKVGSALGWWGSVSTSNDNCD